MDLAPLIDTQIQHGNKYNPIEGITTDVITQTTNKDVTQMDSGNEDSDSTILLDYPMDPDTNYNIPTTGTGKIIGTNNIKASSSESQTTLMENVSATNLDKSTDKEIDVVGKEMIETSSATNMNNLISRHKIKKCKRDIM